MLNIAQGKSFVNMPEIVYRTYPPYPLPLIREGGVEIGEGLVNNLNMPVEFKIALTVL
jgi:hypothetical protein